jgi:hypothetical protein
LGIGYGLKRESPGNQGREKQRVDESRLEQENVGFENEYAKG